MNTEQDPRAGIEWRSDGDPDFYWLSRDTDNGHQWVAKIQFNGEMTLPQQEAMLVAMIGHPPRLVVAMRNQRDQFEAVRNRAQNMYAEMVAQRDGLLTALERTVEAWEKGDDVFGGIQQARAAIAEVNAAPLAKVDVVTGDLKLSETQGMNLGERIKHVGGRITENYSVEFGSVMSVEALIRHVLRDADLAKAGA